VNIPAVQVRWKTADKLFRIGGKRLSQLQKEIDMELEPRSRDLRGMEAELTVDVEPIADQIPNVLAMIPGSDLAHEAVLVTSHFDHLGIAEEGKGTCAAATDSSGNRDTICNGADDNASGTAMVVELAHAFTESGIEPRRSLVFVSFAGEELGLWGSRALAAKPPEAPPFADGKIIAVINLDMVGRLGPRGLAIGGLSSSPDWMPLLDEVGAAGIEVTYERSVSNRGDHVPFYEKKIPVLFFFTHVHKDYHRAGDHADRINREGMAKVGEIVAGVLVKLAAGRAVPFSPPKTEAEGLTGNLPGSDPNTVEKRVKKQ
jgi:Zn-dependent M28 family amino/carboxypeptidase